MAAGLILLAVGGALLAVGQGMREAGAIDGCTAHGGPVADWADEQACREQRVRTTILDALGRGTLGPGIAIVVLAGVYLLAMAITGRRRDPEAG